MTKKEQLRVAFKTGLEKMISKINGNAIKWRMENQYTDKVKGIVTENTNALLKEVSIRTPLK